MDIDTYTVYEIIVPENNERFTVKERYEALAYFRDMCMVFERHYTVHNSTSFIQTVMVITKQWHNNPDFREED